MSSTPLASPVPWGTPAARRVLVTCVLGSSMAFLDATVVNVALPHIGTSLHTELAGLQWVVNAYLVALSALVLVGGSLGDRYGRRRTFLWGVFGFTAASVLAGLAPSIAVLLGARALQGMAAALLVPASLSLLTASIRPEDRARAVGTWSGLTGVAGAVGPLLGGWLVDAASWRWVFLLNVPVAVAVVLTAAGVRDVTAPMRCPVDVVGAVLAAVGIGLGTEAMIDHGSASAPFAAAGAVVILVLFVVVERRRRAPMLPLSLFGSAQFSGANVVTLVVYAGLGVATFLVVLNLQRGLGYSALGAGAALAPITLLLLLLSARVGALAQRIGPTWPMVLGPVVAAGGLLLLSEIGPGDHYQSAVLPGIMVLGLGLAITVAPLTAVVMAAVDESHLGVASGVNNSVARLASLIGVAAVPAIAGVNLTGSSGEGLPGYHDALVLAAAMCATGGLIAALTIRRTRPVRPTRPAALLQPCHDGSKITVRPAA